jgi:dTDP-4-dehydrorhamnose 3,5-epimerase
MRAERLTTTAGVEVKGPLLIKPRVFGDARGFFMESWNQQVFASALEADGQPEIAFVQDNHSRSVKGVLRGLHYQVPPHPQGKLVRCVLGEIFDVAVDLRRDSPSFRQWVAARLSGENHHQLWVPPGFGHGFLTLSERAEVLYKTTDFWNRDCEQAVRWNDSEIAVAWPSDGGLQPQLSEKDAAAPLLVDQPCVF